MCQDCAKIVLRLFKELGSAVEAVAHAAYADQEPWLARLGLDLLAQVGDVGIHNAVSNEGFPAPNFVEQFVAAERAAAVSDESSQELKFNRGYLDGLPSLAQFAPSEVHLHFTEPVNFWGLSRSAAQDCLDPRAQLSRAERLGDIVVGSQLQAQVFFRLL